MRSSSPRMPIDHQLTPPPLPATIPTLAPLHSAASSADPADDLSAYGLPPWLAGKKQASPLLEAYDARIAELTTSNEQLQAQLVALKTRAEELVAESTQSRSDLQMYMDRMIRQVHTEWGSA